LWLSAQHHTACGLPDPVILLVIKGRNGRAAIEKLQRSKRLREELKRLLKAKAAKPSK